MTTRRLYGWVTPNTHRVSILLEELGLHYAVTGVNIRAGEQFTPEILALNRFGKVPILVEGPLVLFESGAILLRLAQTHGRFLGGPEMLPWLMVALTGLGPAMGQAHHWTELAREKPQAARDHALAVVARVFALLETRLSRVPYLGGDDYSIADIAAFPWIARAHWAARDLTTTPRVAAWHEALAIRPAVRRGVAVPVGAVLA